MSDNVETKVELALDQLRRVREDLKIIQTKMDSNFITRVEYNADMGPIKKMVYGLISLVVTSVVVAMVSLVLK